MRQLAADIGIDLIAENRPRAVFTERNPGTALGKTGSAALTFAGNPIALRRIQFAKMHVPFEFCLYRTDLGADLCVELRVGYPFEGFASRYRLLQDVDIVEAAPDLVSGRFDTLLVG